MSTTLSLNTANHLKCLRLRLPMFSLTADAGIFSFGQAKEKIPVSAFRFEE
jgi:hypothetical protein